MRTIDDETDAAETCLRENGCLRVQHNKEYYCPLRISTCPHYTGKHKIITIKEPQPYKEVWYKCNYDTSKR